MKDELQLRGSKKSETRLQEMNLTSPAAVTIKLDRAEIGAGEMNESCYEVS